MAHSEFEYHGAPPRPRGRWPDSARITQSAHSHAAAIMGTAGGNVHKSGPSSVGETAKVKSLIPQGDERTSLFWFFFMGPGQIPTGTSYTLIKSLSGS